jgi:2-polyprenyl-3-methyl-5-hydroxy-6-metoxy-1,4-benzoquinol methylase
MALKCGICSSTHLEKLFSKDSKDHILYTIYSCKNCKIIQVAPLPEQEVLDQYYSNEYFTKRTDRGYDNYYSDSMRQELFRVWTMNLNDLNIELKQNAKPSDDSKSILSRSIDIGCAAGYFVDYMKSLHWDSMGIEIAPDPVAFGRDKLGLNLVQDNFLSWDKNSQNKFQLITLWASIEHMRDPLSILKKIKTHLTEDGIVILSTCRWGFLSKYLKQKWRFLNVPEHLFYFGMDEIIGLMKDLGFEYKSHTTYGSGFTSKKNASFSFRFTKAFMDWLVKRLDQGDMMAISFKNSK